MSFAFPPVALVFTMTRELICRVVEAYRDEHYDKKILAEMGELGFLGATIKGYGCPGIGNVAAGVS